MKGKPPIFMETHHLLNSGDSARIYITRIDK
jgi:hypothetical protein